MYPRHGSGSEVFTVCNVGRKRLRLVIVTMEIIGPIFLLLVLNIAIEVHSNDLDLDAITWDAKGGESYAVPVANFSESERNHLSTTLSVTLDDILNNYDNRLRPNFYGPPVQIQIGVIVKGISSVSEVNMELETDFYFHQSWDDPRLKFNTTHPIPVLTLTHEISKKIWQPDTYFPNEKDSRVHSATIENEFFRWYPSGRVIKSTRLSLKSTCPMTLENFPMDRQVCGIELGSYGLTDFDAQYVWKEDSAISMGPSAGKLLPQFTVLGHRKSNMTMQYAVGNFTYLLCEFLFARSKNYYLIEVYLPCMLIVVISWFPFWMGTKAGAERIGLGLTSMLTMTTLLLSSHSSSPKISYIKALDVYSGVCYAMVFGSLLQSALACYVLVKDGPNTMATRRATWGAARSARVGADGNSNENKSHGSRSADYVRKSVVGTWRKIRSSFLDRLSVIDPENPSTHTMESPAAVSTSTDGGSKAGDRISKILFPVIFLTFNVVYWAYYLNASAHVLGPDWVQL